MVCSGSGRLGHRMEAPGCGVGVSLRRCFGWRHGEMGRRGDLMTRQLFNIGQAEKSVSQAE
jgi:hypothetical protein